MRTWVATFLSLAVSASDALPTRLSLASDAARRSAACAQRVPLEYSQSIPLPVRGEKGLRYRVMFYRAYGEGPRDPNPRVHNHVITAEFNANGADVVCRVPVEYPRPKQRFFGPLGDQMSAATRALSGEAYMEREAKLYTVIERAAQAFAAGRKDAKAAAEFRPLFEAHAEPALKGHYRALAPEFLAWAGIQ